MLSLPNWHPFFVHFPVALFTVAVLCDIAWILRCRYPWLDRAALMLYCAATCSSLASAISGKLAADRLIPQASEEVAGLIGSHGDWAFLTVVLFFVATLVRFDSFWRDRTSERPRVHRLRWVALLLALVGEVILLVTASRGGAAVYRHGVGVERTTTRGGQSSGSIPGGRTDKRARRGAERAPVEEE